MEEKKLVVHVSYKRFKQLSFNKERHRCNDKSIVEACGIIQAEAEGFFKNARRISNPEINLDFVIDAYKTKRILLMDHKCMLDRMTVASTGANMKKVKSHKDIAFKMGA